MYLEELTGSIRLEDQEIECKARLDRIKPQGWLKTVCGFSNAGGGTLFLGVEDKSFKLIGLTRKEADSERNYFNNQINEHISPRPSYTVSFLRYEVNQKELFIIRVDVDESVYKPVILKYDGVPAIYMRRQGFTNGATYEEIIEMSRNSKTAHYDMLATDVDYHPEDFQDLFAFCRERNDGKNVLTEKALTSMGFITDEGKLANGALLFRDGYQSDKTEIHCSVFSGFTKGSERIVSLNKYRGNIIGGIQYMLEYVRQRMNHSVIKLSDSRLNISAYPDRALFEGVINAVAHRNYEMDGTQIQLSIFRDRLEIVSPGGFYQREKIQKTYDLSSIISKRRNELICNVLVRCNAMEAAGTGFEKIEEAYRSAGERYRPYICSETDHFKLVLPDLTYEGGTQDEDIPALESLIVANGTKHDKKVMSYCYGEAHTVKQIAAFLGISDSSYLRKKILGNLVETNCLIEVTVDGKKAYRTNREAL
ncbi:MAG: putative DNA binding domain-containing protein [Clostridia bacterium]|nr:putative DNA binding domain-containing protein [Clostridia bacterium]